VSLELKDVEIERVIWKFPLSLDVGDQEIDMPYGAQIIHVESQELQSPLGNRHIPTMWAMLHPDDSSSKRTFRLIATGEKFKFPARRFRGSGTISEQELRSFQKDGMKHVGTVICGNEAWHIFEVLKV